MLTDHDAMDGEALSADSDMIRLAKSMSASSSGVAFEGGAVFVGEVAELECQQEDEEEEAHAEE